MVTLGTFLITCGKFQHFPDENKTKIFLGTVGIFFAIENGFYTPASVHSQSLGAVQLFLENTFFQMTKLNDSYNTTLKDFVDLYVNYKGLS